MVRPCSRYEAAALAEDYDLTLNCEMYHNHKLIYDDHDVLRWEVDPTIRMLCDMGMLDLNELTIKLGQDVGGRFKNHPMMRDLYRRLGYSLSGYWEIFYWEVNNEYADEWINAAVGETNLGTILKHLRELPTDE